MVAFATLPLHIVWFEPIVAYGSGVTVTTATLFKVFTQRKLAGPEVRLIPLRVTSNDVVESADDTEVVITLVISPVPVTVFAVVPSV